MYTGISLDLYSKISLNYLNQKKLGGKCLPPSFVLSANTLIMGFGRGVAIVPEDHDGIKGSRFDCLLFLF